VDQPALILGDCCFELKAVLRQRCNEIMVVGLVEIAKDEFEEPTRCQRPRDRYPTILNVAKRKMALRVDHVLVLAHVEVEPHGERYDTARDAVDNNYRLATEDNPLAVRIKLFKLGEHRAWTDAECAQFEARWPAGSMQRRAYLLAKYTGQRCGDLATMTRAHRKDGFIRVVQEKTGTELWIREHMAVAAELASDTNIVRLRLLTKASGGEFDADSLSPWFADAIERAGLPDECVLHGLRKTAAKMLAEGSCSEHEIAAITGQSLQMVAHYTKEANQKKLASSAIQKLERNAKGTPSGKRSRPASGKQKPDA
jgi:integrase